jgi:hypothetical protein
MRPTKIGGSPRFKLAVGGACHSHRPSRTCLVCMVRKGQMTGVYAVVECGRRICLTKNNLRSNAASTEEKQSVQSHLQWHMVRGPPTSNQERSRQESKPAQ